MVATFGVEAGFGGPVRPVSEAPPIGTRTQKPLPKGPAEGGALAEGLRGLRDRTAKTGLDLPRRHHPCRS